MDERMQALLALDPAVLSRDELFDMIDAIRETHAALDAQLQYALAAAARVGTQEFRAEQWIREEVASALRIAPITAAARLADATELVCRFSETLRALAEGRITVLHARALVDTVRLLDDHAAFEIESRVLALCDTKTVGEFRAHLKRATLSIAPAQAEQDHADALRQRDVTLQPAEHGMGTLHCHLRIDHALQVMHTLGTHAARLNDDRTIGQRRADVLVDLLTGGVGNGSDVSSDGVAVQITVAASTLSGLDDQPGEVEGYGPIPASLARDLADQARRWRRLTVDPLRHLLDGTETYRPSEPLRRHVVTRDTTCRFPGCRRLAARCDLDHRLPHPDGPTSEANLHALCRRHHRMKHRAGWTVRRDKVGTHWTSPTGRRYEKPASSQPVDTTDPPPF